jgi:hypothetical protein
MNDATKTCQIEGCTRPCKYAGSGHGFGRVCGMHYFRHYNTGSYGSTEPLRAAKGSGWTNTNGYRNVPTKRHVAVPEHRHVWEQHNGPIPASHHIHHINGNKLDNRIENLQCLPAVEHRALHRAKGEVCND